MEILNKLTGEQLPHPTLFAADILASLSQPLENETDKTTLDTSGPGYETPLANYDPDTQFWKMYGDTFLWGDSPLLENLPPSGMTRSGVLFPRPLWVQTTAAIESLSWPTPRASSAMAEDLTKVSERMENGKEYKHKLEQAVALWPTPTTVDTRAGTKKPNPNLMDSVLMRPERGQQPPTTQEFQEQRKMWPTPRAAMGESRNHTVYARSLDKPQNLENSVATSEPSAIGGKLNPTWVEWLMGFPTGWTDLKD
jgi:hypothetical protein